MEQIPAIPFVELLLALAVVCFVIALGVILLYQHFQKNLYSQRLREHTLKNAYQNDLLRYSIESEEAERNRIAQDLHDELGAVLSILRMNVVLLEKNMSTENTASAGMLASTRQLAEAALTSMRHISHRLMPPQLAAFGLASTLEAVIEKLNQGDALRIGLEVCESAAALPATVSLGLYRILMELVNNTIRHSGATEAAIRLEEDAAGFTCTYTDNGKGLQTDAQDKGLGFKSIQGRAQALNGIFQAGNGDAGGFRATVRLPME